MPNTFVTVIIPTYNDWDCLSLCLDALSVQSYPHELFEIIVVNNKPGSVPPAGFRVPDNCKIIDEAKPGSYASRNAGINIAKGEIIAFTDSDCIPDKNWLIEGVAYMLSNPQIGRIAGRIDLFYRSPKLVNVELYEKIYAFNQELYVKNDATAVTANIFTYKKSFDVAGLFNENLMSGGDYEWSVRAQKAGIPIHYVDTAIVNHPARYNLDELVTKAKRVGGGQAKFSADGKDSLLKTITRFIYDLRPPVKSITLINSRGKDLSLLQKLTVFQLRYYLSIVTAYEKFLVRKGKTPSRV
ncbi:glycosyltransferase [Mucilaginibacter aquaedulcis]|uniref:glycosyltransferase n=1 Tax=Mucilaginibacter aquaedulcis TaxID=1187081 RepID=UPI0025B56496|nr:glycosyltransferase family A protein [Mucilaginibacter aquaedulcis]MDN3550476.1 glycosyltransferase family A protein [Mucilaginibacter aquaedulcis]